MQSSGRDDNLGQGFSPLPLGSSPVRDGEKAVVVRGLLENPATIIAVLLTLMVAFFALAR